MLDQLELAHPGSSCGGCLPKPLIKWILQLCMWAVLRYTMGWRFQAMPALLMAVVDVNSRHILTVIYRPNTLIEGMVVKGKSLQLTTCLQACKSFCWSRSTWVVVDTMRLSFTHSCFVQKGWLWCQCWHHLRCLHCNRVPKAGVS